MKSLLIASVTAITMSVAGAAAQSSGDPATSKAAAPVDATASAATPSFIDRQQEGQVRAPKLIGVAVYDANNKSVGKIGDLLLDKGGSVKAVVIAVGGVLGIGAKYVAVPYDAIKWQTEQRTVATDTTADNSLAAKPMGATATPSERIPTKTIDPAKTEAYQGYPDRAIVDLTQAQLKSAPEFKYAQNPNSDMNASAPAVVPTPPQKP